jgi:hypothetical protein
LKNYKSPGNGQIPAELIQAGGETLQFEIIHKLTNSSCSKEEFPDHQFTRRAIKLTAVIIEDYHFYQLRTKFYTVPFSQG